MTKILFLRLKFSIYLIVITLPVLLCACTGNTDSPVPPYTPAPNTLTPQPSTLPDTATATTSGTSTPKATSTAATSATRTPIPGSVNSLPNPEDAEWQVIANGLNQPVGLVSAYDGSGRLFVLEQAGVIRVMQNGVLLPEPFLDLRARVSTQGSTTAGLLGLAFHPNFATNGYFYVHYTQPGGSSVIARYGTSSEGGGGDPASEQRLFEISFPIGEHKGGDLNFGPDGYLYLSIGDGGANGYGDQENNAQNPGTLLGSILRVDVDRAEPYGIPADNPFASGGGRPEVWAYGLRNPWRFTFDRLSGEMYVADVGENRWEEINYLPASSPGGANFGWSYVEGTDRFKGQPPVSLDLIYPVAQYDHTLGCSVTGGVVYRGTALPEWFGVYVYGDFCQGNIWGLLKRPDGSWENELLHKVQGFITSFGQDETGEVYLVDLTGEIFKLIRKQQ